MSTATNFTQTARKMLRLLYDKQLQNSSMSFRAKSNIVPPDVADHVMRLALQIMEKKEWVKVNWDTDPLVTLAPEGILEVESEAALADASAQRDTDTIYELREDQKITTAKALRLAVEAAQTDQELSNEQRSQILAELEAAEKIINAPHQRKNILASLVVSLRKWAAALPARTVSRLVDKFIDELLKQVPDLLSGL